MYLEGWPNASARKAAPREGTAFLPVVSAGPRLVNLNAENQAASWASQSSDGFVILTSPKPVQDQRY